MTLGPPDTQLVTSPTPFSLLWKDTVDKAFLCLLWTADDPCSIKWGPAGSKISTLEVGELDWNMLQGRQESRHFRSSHALGSAPLSSAPSHLRHSGPQQPVSGPGRAGIAVRAEGLWSLWLALAGRPLQWFAELISPPPTVTFSVVVPSLSRVVLFATSRTEAH